MYTLYTGNLILILLDLTKYLYQRDDIFNYYFGSVGLSDQFFSFILLKNYNKTKTSFTSKTYRAFSAPNIITHSTIYGFSTVFA